MIAFVVKGGIDLWSLEHVQNGTKIKWFFTSITSSKILSFCKGEWESRLDFTFPGLSSNSKSEGDAWDSAVVVNIHCPVRISISKEGLLGKVLSSIRNIMEQGMIWRVGKHWRMRMSWWCTMRWNAPVCQAIIQHSWIEFEDLLNRGVVCCSRMSGECTVFYNGKTDFRAACDHGPDGFTHSTRVAKIGCFQGFRFFSIRWWNSSV